MKKINLLVSLCFLVAILASEVSAQKLDKFGADMGKKSVLGKEIRLPYQSVSSYFGYVKAGAPAEETRDGKKYYYLYIWIPAVAPELGIRMISPAPDGVKPNDKDDFFGTDFKANATDTKSYFDTWVTLEKAEGVLSLADVSKAKTAKWNSFGSNDDSGELHAQPSGSKYNSVLRVTSEASNPLKALTVGLYRIGFTTYKTGEVQGSFLAQVGAPVKLPGVVIAQTPEGVQKAAEDAKKK